MVVFLPSQRPSSTTTRIKTFPLLAPADSSLATQRPSSTTTRIKTQQDHPEQTTHPLLKDHHPQQQGLRQNNAQICTVSTAQRPSSTTTRIKTRMFYTINKKNNSQRPSSTTTRIKTVCCSNQLNYGTELKDHHPQQQGLRQINADLTN